MIGDAIELERSAIDEVVADRTIVDVLARNAEAFGDRTAISWRAGSSWERLTWQEYREKVLHVAAGLIEAGCRPGDRIAIMAGNRPEHVLADLGALHAGATPVTVYSTLAPDQIAFVARHSRATMAVVEDEATLRRWSAVRSAAPDLATIVVIDSAPADEIGVLSWSVLLDSGAEARRRNQQALADRVGSVSQADLATLIYTSGTTGEPKGVAITHHNVLWTVETMRQAVALPEHPRLISYLPLAHIAERMATHYLGLWVVGQVAYCANLAAVMGMVRDVEPHMFVAVPRIWEQIHRRLTARLGGEADPRKRALTERAIGRGREAVDGELTARARAELLLLDRLVLRRIRRELGLGEAVVAVTTAGPIDVELIKEMRALGLPLHELYGMTECSGPATTNLPGHDRIGSVGRAFAGVGITLASDGELLISGGNVAAGYFRAPEATAKVFGIDGWLRSGDLATIDEDGYVYIVGRKKDIIVDAAGKNISPVSIEQLLKRHSIVAEACVAGDRRPHLVAVISVDGVDAAHLGPDAVADAVAAAVADTNQRVSNVERIRRYEVVADQWSPENGLMTPSLKLRRAAVLEHYSDLIDAMYGDRRANDL